MASSISSAEWPKLFRYSDRALQIDGELAGEGSRIAGILRNFEASCTEYRVAVSHLAGDIRGYAHRAEGTDAWVRTVGADFQRADQVGSVVFGGDTSRQFLFDILIAERAARVGFAKGLRFRPYAGWGAFFRDTILKFGYRGKWTVSGSRSALRAAGIFKNVRWFSYKYLTKVLTIKSGSWTAAARAAFSRLLRQPGSIFRKLPGAIDAFVRKMPRNSSLLPTATFKQRIAEAFGKGASLGGKFKSAAGIGILLTFGANIYEFTGGVNRHLGLWSRQFVSATVADVSATLSIIAVSTAVGSLIPIPVVGTVAGFIVGVGLAFAYDKWGKDAWRKAVDGAGKRLQDALTPAQRAEQVQSYKQQRDTGRAAADGSQQISKQASSSAVQRISVDQRNKPSEKIQALFEKMPFETQWNGTTGGLNCGPASFTMIINYYLEKQGRKPIGMKDVVPEIPRTDAGTDFKVGSSEEWKTFAERLAKEHIVQENVTNVDELKQHLDEGHPVIIAIHNNHIVRPRDPAANSPQDTVPYPGDTAHQYVWHKVGNETKETSHIVVVTGYVPGANGQPKEIIINDPLAVKSEPGSERMVADEAVGKGFRVPWEDFKDAADSRVKGGPWYASATFQKNIPN